MTDEKLLASKWRKFSKALWMFMLGLVGIKQPLTTHTTDQPLHGRQGIAKLSYSFWVHIFSHLELPNLQPSSNIKKVEKAHLVETMRFVFLF